MDKIPLTNFQLIAYFVPGFVSVVGCFVAFEHISSFCCLIECLKGLNVAFLVLSLIASFIIGLIFDAVRNGILDNFIDCMISRRWLRFLRLQRIKIDWSYFYKGEKEEVGTFYARYFTYYCFDLNLLISLGASVAILVGCKVFSRASIQSLIIYTTMATLLIDAISLRRDMAKATGFGPKGGQAKS